MFQVSVDRSILPKGSSSSRPYRRVPLRSTSIAQAIPKGNKVNPMTLDEYESKQRYNDFLREVEQEQLYQRAKAGQKNVISIQKLNKWLMTLILLVFKIR